MRSNLHDEYGKQGTFYSPTVDASTAQRAPAMCMAKNSLQPSR